MEESYPEAEAQRQAGRCLRCNINTVFDTSICVACNGCVDVCPQNLIRLVGLGQLVMEEVWSQRIAANVGVTVAELQAMSTEELDNVGAVMTKDETSCIRCAMCASRCPTHAITMQRFDYRTECVSSPAARQGAVA